MAPSPFVLSRPATHPGAAPPAVAIASSPSAVTRLTPVTEVLTEYGGEVELLTEDAGAAADAVAQAVDRARPAVALVAGDRDREVAGALAAHSLGVPIARIGAGLRCRDRGDAAEVNRIVLDGLADRLYVDGEDSLENLLAEGIPGDRIVVTGSTIADVVLGCRDAAIERRAWRELDVPVGEYVLVALRELGPGLRAGATVEVLAELAKRAPLVVCTRPETSGRLEPLAAVAALVDPLKHLDFLSLQAGAGCVVTDSGGVQEETSVLGVPCFTLRYGTERVMTLTHGTNVLLGDDPAELAGVVEAGRQVRIPATIPYWDGGAGRRIADDLLAEALP